jgi:hypothetical protein
MLYAETIKGGLYPTAHTLLALAQTSKHHRDYINNNIIAILESQPTSKALELVKLLRHNTASLPVLCSAHVEQWCTDAPTRLTNGDVMYYFIAGTKAELDPKIKANIVLQLCLIDKNIDIHKPVYKGKTSLYVAVDTGQTEIVRFLLESGANPNLSDKWGNTPLMMAKEIDSQEIIQLLENYGADRTVRNNQGKTIDDIKASWNKIDSIKRFHDRNPFKKPRN